MKKLFSLALVAAMLLCMAPAFSLFAAEADLTTIDSAEELLALVETANATGRDYRKGETIKVTADIDMTGKTWVPFNEAIFTLDFDGHTLSNVKLTVDNASGDVGLLAKKLSNNNANGLITNLKLKNCELTVNSNSSCNVGIVGYADRANVTNIEIDGLTITHTGGGYVGVLMGSKSWGFASDINATMKNVTVDAPYANVGVVCGTIGGADKFNLTGLDAAITVKRSLNDIANDTYTVTGGDKLTVADTGVSATVTDQQDGKRTNYKEIGSAEDLIALADAYNKFGKNFLGNSEIKITADIDMTGKAWTPIKEATFVLNGQGHTITGLSVTVDSADSGSYGLLVNFLGNNPGNGRIKDLTVKDSIITVTSTATEDGKLNVGAVCGATDRGVITNVNLTNVTVKVVGKANAGALAGRRDWSASDDKVTGTLTNVLIDAPDARVGVVCGYSWGDINATVENFTANVAVSEGTNITAEDGKVILVAQLDNGSKCTEGEGNTVTATAATADSGYVPPKAPETKPETKPAETGDAIVVLAALAVVALAATVVVSKKRSTAC